MAFNQIPHEVYLKHILPYVIKPPMKLLDWIDIENLDWKLLSNNINAIDLLEANQDKINWKSLSMNRSDRAIKLFKENRFFKRDSLSA